MSLEAILADAEAIWLYGHEPGYEPGAYRDALLELVRRGDPSDDTIARLMRAREAAGYCPPDPDPDQLDPIP